MQLALGPYKKKKKKKQRAGARILEGKGGKQGIV
jgi:hypothetical protein